MVSPVTVQPWFVAKKRVVPPMPQPTSRTVLPDRNRDRSSKSAIRRVWATSFVSVGVRKYPWWMCSPLSFELAECHGEHGGGKKGDL